MKNLPGLFVGVFVVVTVVVLGWQVRNMHSDRNFQFHYNDVVTTNMDGFFTQQDKFRITSVTSDLGFLSGQWTNYYTLEAQEGDAKLFYVRETQMKAAEDR